MTKDNARKKTIRARMEAAAEPYSVARRHLESLAEQDGLFPLALVQSTGTETPLPRPGQDGGSGNNGSGLILAAVWPDEPEPVDPGEGTRADRLRMLRRMRKVWNDFNTERRTRVNAEVHAARERQAEVSAYWGRHQDLVKERWPNRTGGRGETTVADIPEVAAQWHPDNPLSPEKVSAMAQQRRAASPYR